MKHHFIVRWISVPILSVLLLTSTGCSLFAPKDQSVLAQAADEHKALEPAVMEDAKLSNYLQSVGDRIIEAAVQLDREHVGPKAHFDQSQDNKWMFSDKMQFHLVNSKTLNAFTTGGEHMYVYNALFQQCKTEDELAAVMAHEYAHVYCRHVAQGMQHQMTTLIAGALVGGAAGYALGGSDNKLAAAGTGAAVGAGAGHFLNMGFTRKDEAEADEYGFKFYTRAGWDPKHFGDFFQHMIDMGLDTTPELASDHPTLKSRVDAANQRVKALGSAVDKYRRDPIASPAEFKQLQARANELAKTLPSDQSLQNSQKLAQALPRSCVAPVDPPDAVKARQDLANQAEQGKKAKKKKKSSS
jgi:predicted Zn-dependent protease